MAELYTFKRELKDGSVTSSKIEGIKFVNLYEYPNNCINDKYLDNSGNISNLVGAAYAKISVKENTQYTIFLPSGNYAWGVYRFDNENNAMISNVKGYEYKAGKYLGIDYITIETPANCVYLLFNTAITNQFDNKETMIIVEGDGENLVNNEDIAKMFELYIADTKNRKELKDLKSSFVAYKNNIYNYDTDFVDGKYTDTSGNISTFANWGMAKVSVSENTKYSLLLPNNPTYSGMGSIGFYNSNNTKISFINQATKINGKYNNQPYVTIETPTGTSYMVFTCKHPNSFDNSTDLLLFESASIDNFVADNYLIEYGGYNVDLHKHHLYSQKWVVLGDSLTEVNDRATMRYYDYVQEIIKCTIVNMGVGGSGYKKREGESKAFYQRVLNVPTDTDFITIFGSGNDLALITSQSDVTSVLGSATDTGTTTICGCINKTIDNLYTILPTARLGIVTPTPWSAYPPTTANNYMELYSQKLVEIAKRRGIPVLDLYHCSNLRPWDATFRSLMYSRDGDVGIHPDENGHKQISNMFLTFVSSL